MADTPDRRPAPAVLREEPRRPAPDRSANGRHRGRQPRGLRLLRVRARADARPAHHRPQHPARRGGARGHGSRRARSGRRCFLFRHRLASGELRDVEVHCGPVRARPAQRSSTRSCTTSPTGGGPRRPSPAATSATARSLEGIEEGYYEVDLQGNFTFVNAALCLILGRAARGD